MHPLLSRIAHPLPQVQRQRVHLQKECGNVVDAYVEYDIVLIIIDLMLQYITAYRHLLVNTKNHVRLGVLFHFTKSERIGAFLRPKNTSSTSLRSYHKLFIVFLLCDAYSKWIRRRIIAGTENIYDLEWKFYECLLQSALEMLSFLAVLVYLLWPGTLRIISRKLAMQICCAGFYGNVFVVLSIVWDLHVVWSYRALTELFIFISHVQTQRGDFCSFPKMAALSVASLKY
ncbi:unnamed protein product [Gongylonema pulchrum]|uniref:Protein ARV n=1 Tax=Gongylonema pulchrum TaxID=637853 RepID=A0A183EB30_9BILA|nr:unnamed protein product [Gongylonema pulchrum]